MAEKFLVPIYLPRWLHGPIREIKRALVPSANALGEEGAPIDLTGDRDVEWSYVASRLPTGRGYVLDFGSGVGSLSIHAIQKGHHVVALDLENNHFPWSHPNLQKVYGSLFEVDLREACFDYVLNCSTIEHVGLSGRYGIAVEESGGDLAAMRKLRLLLKSSGKMLMTIPVGHDMVIAPWHRVYGEKRLPELLKGYEIEEEFFWIKKQDNIWYPSERESALAVLPTGHPTRSQLCSYALGCFVLGVTP